MRTLDKILLGTALILGINGCNALPKYAREAVEPLMAKTADVCESAGRDQKKFDSNLKNLKYLVEKKNLVLEALGCNPGCIEWRCGRDDVFSEFEFYENKTGDCNCPEYDTLGEALFYLPKRNQKKLVECLSD